MHFQVSECVCQLHSVQYIDVARLSASRVPDVSSEESLIQPRAKLRFLIDLLLPTWLVLDTGTTSVRQGLPHIASHTLSSCSAVCRAHCVDSKMPSLLCATISPRDHNAPGSPTYLPSLCELLFLQFRLTHVNTGCMCRGIRTCSKC